MKLIIHIHVLIYFFKGYTPMSFRLFLAGLLSLATTMLAADQAPLKTPRFIDVKNLYVQVPHTAESAKDTKDPKKLKLEVDLPDQQTILARAFDVFGAHVELSVPDPVNLDSSFLKKMDFFTKSQEEGNIVSKLNKTATQGGHAMLATMLSLPTHNVERIQKNQAIIQYLLEHPQLAHEIEEHLQVLAQNEPHFFSYFADEPSSNQELYKKVYFGTWLNHLNDNPTALEVAGRLTNAVQAIGAAFYPLFVFGISTYVQKYKAGSQGEDISWMQASGRTVQSIPHLPSFCTSELKTFKEHSLTQMAHFYPENQLWSKASPQSLGDCVHIFDTLNPQNAAFNRILFYVYPPLFVPYQAYGTYRLYKEFTEQNNVNYYLQERLIGIASYLNAAKELFLVAQQHPILLEIPLIEQLAALFNPEHHFSGKAQKLLNLLDHTTFTGSPSFFSLSGRVLAAHTLMHEVKYEFVPVIAAASMVDMFASHAKVFASYQDTPVKCCFVQFVESPTPYLEAHNFWHILLDPATAVANDITLSTDNKQNFVLTGANTGGKSTILKSLVLVATLGQTAGYACADSVVMSPFVVINCYLNITDDISSGQSTFAAETERAKKLLAEVEGALQRSIHPACLVVIDEIFSGTDPEVGKKAAYYFAERLGAMPNTLVGIATHFKELGNLEKTSTFKNFNVVAYKNEQGKWVRPFKLFDGVSTTNIALDLLEDEGIISRSGVCAA